jgi:hypothetical protein
MVPIVKFIAFFLFFSFVSIFAQESSSSKFAVYVSGAKDAGINKVLGNKLLASITQGGKYVEIEDTEAFYNELAKNEEISYSKIYEIAKRYGADFVCVVRMIEVFNVYSISARIVKIANSQVVRNSSIDRSLNSMDDLTRVSNELVRLLLMQAQTAAQVQVPSQIQPPPQAQPSPQIQQTVPASVTPVVAGRKKPCVDTEKLISQIAAEFPKQLGTCGTKMAANMALPGFLKNKLSEEEKDPQKFMIKCPIKGIKEKVPALSKLEGATDKIESFTQTLVKTALSGGSFDAQKLLKAASDISSLTSSIKDLAPAEGEECEEVPEASEVLRTEEYDEYDEYYPDKRKFFSLGFRTGFNFSHIYEKYNIRNSGSLNSIAGFQAGLAFDMAATDWFHFQPNIMYIQKGAKSGSSSMTSHYIEFPVLASLKFSVVRLNAGPYFSLCVGAGNGSYEVSDVGFSYGGGFDMGSFYLGMLYNYGLADINSKTSYASYNRTFGFNLGYNL